jgi:hypothetical protein
MENESVNASEYYSNKGIKHLTNVILYIILSVVVYFIFFRNKEFSLENLLTLLPLTGMALIFVFFVKFGFNIAGILGAIIGIIIFVIATGKLDEFLIANNLPTDDSVYNPIFGTIATVYVLYHLILGIVNMKRSSMLIKSNLNVAETNTQSESVEKIDFAQMARDYETQLEAQLKANAERYSKTNLKETSPNE